MSDAGLIKKKLKKLEENFPEAAHDIERELIPLSGEEVKIKKKKQS
jgi:hypothetical protein